MLKHVFQLSSPFTLPFSILALRLTRGRETVLLALCGDVRRDAGFDAGFDIVAAVVPGVGQHGADPAECLWQSSQPLRGRL